VSVGDRAYTLELKDGVDDAVAFDAQSGREVWRARIAETYRGHDGSHDGPIGTPAIDGNDLAALGPHGHLVMLNAIDGKERWRARPALPLSTSATERRRGRSTRNLDCRTPRRCQWATPAS
jgi:outer membrane protein assembly factor BamB